MTFSITIDDPDHSLSDEEESSGVHGHLPTDPVGHEFVDYEDLHLAYPDELKGADPASRPRNAHRSRHSLHGSRSASARRQTSRTARRQQMIPEREFASRNRARHHSPESPESLDSGEDFAGQFGRAADRRIWPGVPQAPGYAQSSSSGPSYSAHPYGHGLYGHPGHQSDEVLRLGQQPPYGSSAYAYGPQFQPPYSASMQPFYPSDQHQHARHHRQPPLPRADAYNPLSMVPPGGPPFNPQDLMPYGAPNHYYRDPFSMVPHQSYFSLYPQVPTPTKAELSSPAPHPVDVSKDEAIARLEKLILDDRTEREAREAAIARAQAEKAAQEERLAHDQKIAEQAAFLARADAEKRAAEDAAKLKEEAEKAAASAASTAAKKPPAEKKKPIKFKDAVGRKFSFPFELCATWQGMEDLIRQAFLHIEVIGPHVAEGHYDLVGPNGDIILPQVWETVIEPDWTITMHMWPVPEKPKDEAGGKDGGGGADGKKKADPGKKEKGGRQKKSDPGTIAMWMMGGRNPTRTTKAPKAEKKPEATQ